MTDVYVYIYDLSKGLARTLSPSLLGRQIDGVWHTGIVAFGTEWYFGSGGISSCPPCGTILGQPEEKKLQGRTHVAYEDFMSHLNNLSRTTFKASDYHLLDHNCNTFSDEVSQFLTGNKIPPHITGLPQEVMSTPFGQMLRPMLDQMSVDPGNNSNPFNNYPYLNGSPSPASPHVSSGSGAASKATSSLPLGKSISLSASTVEAAIQKLKVSLKDPDSLLDEIKEFMAVTTASSGHSPDWSIGRPHLNFLVDAAANSTECKAACEVVSVLLNAEDILAMVTKDPKKPVQKMMGLLAGGNLETIQVFANLTHHQEYHQLFLETDTNVDGQTTYSILIALMEKTLAGQLDMDHLWHFSVLYFNTCLGLLVISTSPASEEKVANFSLELVTPMLEFLLQHQDKDIAFGNQRLCLENLVSAIDFLTKASEEAAQLCKCYGLDSTLIGQWSEETGVVARRVFG